MTTTVPETPTRAELRARVAHAHAAWVDAAARADEEKAKFRAVCFEAWSAADPERLSYADLVEITGMSREWVRLSMIALRDEQDLLS